MYLTFKIILPIHSHTSLNNILSSNVSGLLSLFFNLYSKIIKIYFNAWDIIKYPLINSFSNLKEYLEP